MEKLVEDIEKISGLKLPPSYLRFAVSQVGKEWIVKEGRSEIDFGLTAVLHAYQKSNWSSSQYLLIGVEDGTNGYDVFIELASGKIVRFDRQFSFSEVPLQEYYENLEALLAATKFQNFI